MSGNWRTRLGRTVSAVYPRLDKDIWALGRIRHTRRALHALRADIDALRVAGIDANDAVHLIVVASNGPDSPSWHVAGGNIFFEVYQSAVELLGADRVTLFGAARDERELDWQRRLLHTLVETRATHVIAQIEGDPNQAHNWSWDVVVAVLAESWDGTFLACMYDSVHEWLQIRAQRLGRLLPNLVIVDLCVPMSGFIRKGRPEVGPVTMPMSAATVAAIDEHVAGLSKEFDVTFIGALYDYRVELLDNLAANGMNVAVNPHRTSPAHDYGESRSNQPSYLDYMAGLARSESTINFSLASGGPQEQYKIRVLEAALVGCLCLTDDRDRTRLFFAANEFRHFDDPPSLAAVATATLADRERLHRDQASARARARELARSDFWSRIEDVLHSRGLAALTRARTPSAPDDPAPH